MNRKAHENPKFQELDYRESDGIEVSLLWSREHNDLSVLVVDTRCDEIFELTVAPGEALEVFNHPFAYAATRKVTPDPGPQAVAA